MSRSSCRELSQKFRPEPGLNHPYGPRHADEIGRADDGSENAGELRSGARDQRARPAQVLWRRARARRRRPRRGARDGARPARPQRRRQDDGRARHGDAAGARCRRGAASPASTSCKDAAKVRERIGLAGQYAAIDENLTGLENLVMVGRLYGMRRAPATVRGRELLDRFDLTEAAGRPAKTYSGGMRRRLDLGGGARRQAAGPVPRRADDRPGSAQPPRSSGRRSRSSSPRAAQCCSRRSTSTRPTASPTRSR